MIKLNNKGMTIVEVLVCFVIVAIVMMSLFSTVSSFNEKRIQESYRSKIYTFKNEWTSRVQEDFIRKGISYAKVVRSIDDQGLKYTINCTLKTGEKRQLIIYQRFTLTNKRLTGSPDRSDRFYLEYGEPGNLFHEELPELGKIRWGCDDPSNGLTCKVANSDLTDTRCGEQCTSQDFQINNIRIEITNEDDQDSNAHVLVVFISFTHPDFSTRYAIDIVAPIDYQGSNAAASSEFKTSKLDSDKENKILDVKEEPVATPTE